MLVTSAESIILNKAMEKHILLSVRLISDCMNTTESGYYILLRNITGSQIKLGLDIDICLIISASNIVIDGMVISRVETTIV